MTEQIYEQQSESDEDCEVYFLKPVNEYNIIDKIKEANKELFADSALGEKVNSGSMDSESTTKISTNTITTTTTTTKMTTMRKVTFAPNLEDYEPENLKKTDIEEFSHEDGFSNSMKTELTKFPTIDEEEQIGILEEHIDNGDRNSSNSNEKSQLTTIVHSEADKNGSSNSDLHNENNVDVDDDEIDEICEEIIVMEMESSTSTIKTSTLPNNDDSFSAQHRRAILKQTTFDCDEQDNKSLMNLLTSSDGEEDDSRATLKGTDNIDDDDNDDDDDANDSSIFIGIDDFEEDVDVDADNEGDYDNNGNDYDDDDDEYDDDKLSLIVASYLPDDFEHTVARRPKSPSSNNSVGKSRSFFRRNTSKATTPTPTTSTSSSSATSFSKRFQLRRKARSTNSIGTMCSNSVMMENTENSFNTGGNRNNDNVMGLKLNYKTCCEYRNSIQGKLPKYTGYLSEYGLSREQLQERENKLQKKKRFVLEQAMKTNDHEMRKMKDNERAFTTWLRNKMRFPINKTRNMFDVKLRFIGNKKTSAGNNSNGTSGNSQNIGPLGCSGKVKIN